MLDVVITLKAFEQLRACSKFFIITLEDAN